MKKIAFIFALLANQAFAAIPVSITFNVPSAAYIADVEISRLQQRTFLPLEGAVSISFNAAAASMTITGTCPAANTAVIIDQEPILVTSGVGTSVCGITRNSALAQAGTVAAAHSAGATIFELLYPTAQIYFVRVGVQSFLEKIIKNLNTNSAVNGTAISAIATNQASVDAALAGAAQ